ncbi:transaldolase/EF-hand domain-containing protein [Aquisphaera giovannonii]|uniref:Transaldolase/EF-hand domain-containing protein n=1 Tax=Aquisphaera giovannonii TaxID=406548 RepID=A0A5B9VWL4_9BACT|nr:EF-hand domain-containing protein [Aquisphaera giovannonii]QEH32638.1 transaldolase/EF-hand domain-containing protein [Aquisphaera giovannonii]
MTSPAPTNALRLAVLALAALAMAVIAHPAAADDAKPSAKKAKKAQAAQPLAELFRDLDANSDKVIERQEVPESGRKAFDSLLKYADANHDEKLQPEEYKALVSKVRLSKVATLAEREARLQKLDKNGDGKLDLAEYSQAEAQFKKLDKNHDGLLDRSEIPWMNPDQPKEGKKAEAKAAKKADAKAAKKAAKSKPAAKPEPEVAADMKPDAKADAKVAEKAEEKAARSDGKADDAAKPSAPDSVAAKGGAKPGKLREAVREKFKAMDKDGDGRISRSEFDGRPKAFDRLDANHDGYLDKEDLKQARQAKARKTAPKS